MVIEEPDRIPSGAGGTDFKPTGAKTIGKFYAEISHQLDGLGDGHIIDVKRQIDLTAYFDIAPAPFSKVSEAKHGIEIIVDQGEGAGGTPFGLDGKPAHFYQFASLAYTGRLTGTGSGPFSYSPDPSLKYNPRRQGLPTDPPATPGSKDFDISYLRMLDDLQAEWDKGSGGDLGTAVFTTMLQLQQSAIGIMNQGTAPASHIFPPCRQPLPCGP
jgi:hypothetical protein